MGSMNLLCVVLFVSITPLVVTKPVSHLEEDLKALIQIFNGEKVKFIATFQ